MNEKLAQFAHQNYLNFETFRKSGGSVKTPVWFVQDGDKLFVRTANSSGKVKRVRNNRQVNVVLSGVTGEPIGEWLAAQACELTDADSAGLVDRLLVEKYGDQVVKFASQVRASGLEYTVILIEVM